MKKPNVIYVFADQWRAQDINCAGNKQIISPNIDKLAAESIYFEHAVSSMPCCCPYRGTLMTGQYPVTHGVFINDVPLVTEAETLADVFNTAGYQTAYVGKWHIDGQGRSNYIPPERRHGFYDYWKVLECTHDYNDSFYYEGDSDEKKEWPGYDAIEQTKDFIQYIESLNNDQPFLGVLSWGPPHAPYLTAPQKYQDMYNADDIILRDNVPDHIADDARMNLAGYYAHITALDDCVADLLACLEKKGIANNTIFVLTSDHGDMMGSHGQYKKQRPLAESVRVPFMLRWPDKYGREGRTVSSIIDSPDIMPTLLSLCDLPIPETVQGCDRSTVLGGEEDDAVAFYNCLVPFGQWTRDMNGKECRGILSKRYTYVADLEGPWLLYDNETDPYQMTNLINQESVGDIQQKMDQQLREKLIELGDEFREAEFHLDAWNYSYDKETLTVPFTY
ncbi:MAG: sulfatase [Lentisphaeria bacterium]|nr:sulfatase [Lentisphaeria bacterium]NQZ70847.1 sulfatase [Lentisphaeria bacterium]